MVISFVNLKGGVGKTTCTLNIAAGLGRMGKRVLLIDADAQASLTTGIGLSYKEPKTLYNVLKEETALEDAIHPQSANGHADLVPSSFDVAAIETETVGMIERERVLGYALEPVKSRYDYVLIDCPPSLGIVTINALVASDQAFVPISDIMALEGMAKIVERIKHIKRRINPELTLGGVIVTRYDDRKVICKEVVRSLREHYGEALFSNMIRENVSLLELSTSRTDIFRYAPKSNGAKDFEFLCAEIDERVQRLRASAAAQSTSTKG
jgi:chromosome partitioning protein